MTAFVRRLPVLETTLFVASVLVLVAVALLGRHRDAGSAVFDSYSTYDAAGGGYRAWYELMGREGVAVERFAQRPAFLDPSLDTLVWSEPLPFDPHQQQPTDADVAALEAWVRAGGHLLYIGHDDAAAKAGILHLPGTRASRARGGPSVARELQAAGVRNVASSAVLRWRLPKAPVRVLVSDTAGPLVLAYGFGRGRVVAVIDEALFANARLTLADRARLAYALAAPARPGGVVAFDEAVHGYAVPDHWWTIVPRPFAVALGIAVFVLLVAFAGAAVRLGPPVIPIQRADRSSAEFLSALASLLDRGGAAEKALADATASTTRAVARTLGVSEAASGDALAARLEPGELRASFERLLALARGHARTGDLIAGVALAARIRKDCSAHARARN